jgi:hypothetical protein
VVNGVHGDATHAGPPAKAPPLARLAVVDHLLQVVADDADRRAAVKTD